MTQERCERNHLPTKKAILQQHMSELKSSNTKEKKKKTLLTHMLTFCNICIPELRRVYTGHAIQLSPPHHVVVVVVVAAAAAAVQ